VAGPTSPDQLGRNLAAQPTRYCDCPNAPTPATSVDSRWIVISTPPVTSPCWSAWSPAAMAASCVVTARWNPRKTHTMWATGTATGRSPGSNARTARSGLRTRFYTLPERRQSVKG
jgi:hypothetical protein